MRNYIQRRQNIAGGGALGLRPLLPSSPCGGASQLALEKGRY